jgi:hypothetical protein
MGGFSDCYVLAKNRTSETAFGFLEKFASNSEPCWDPIDPIEVIGSPEGLTIQQLTHFLELRPNLDYSMYFRNQSNAAPYYSILTYNPDGSLILGLSGDPNESCAIELLRELELYSGTQGYWTVEEAPVSSAEEFLARHSQYLTTQSR